MRKTLVIALGAAVALVTAAVALAAVYTASGVSATTASLTTTTATNVKTRTCTGADGKSFAVTDGRYTGLADFTVPGTDLDGPLTIHARSTVETTAASAKLGYVEGSFRVKDDDTRLSGKFWGTLDASGKLAGFLTGSSRGHHAKVLGTLSGTFAPATGFVGAGALGTNSTSATLAVVAGPVCKGHLKPAPKPKPVRPVHVHGTVTAISPTQIIVTSKGPTTTTCAIAAPPTSPSTAGIAVSNRVEMTCELLGVAPAQVWTLTKLHLNK